MYYAEVCHLYIYNANIIAINHAEGLYLYKIIQADINESGNIQNWALNSQLVTPRIALLLSPVNIYVQSDIGNIILGN